jgi:prevent-host-death family protein
MSEIQVSMSKLRQNLGSLVNRAAYGGERVVLVAHGEAKAAIIGIEDLQRLQQLRGDSSAKIDAADLQAQIRELQVAYRPGAEGSTMALKWNKTEALAAVERLKLAKLLLDSILTGPSGDETEWSALGLDAFEKEWDNPEDAIYDDWRDHYDLPTG